MNNKRFQTEKMATGIFSKIKDQKKTNQKERKRG